MAKDVSTDWQRSSLAIGLLLLCCFPVGLFLVWTNPTWDKRRKWMWTGIFAACVAVGGSFRQVEIRQVADDLAKADAQWNSGHKAEAVTYYKAAEKKHWNDLSDEDKPIILNRIIEFHAEANQSDEVKLWTEKAERRGVSITVKRLPVAGLPEVLTDVTEKNETSDPKAKGSPSEINLASGPVSIDVYIDLMKRGRHFELTTPERGFDIAGTKFEYLGEIFGEECRIHIASKKHTQKVTALLIESGDNRQLVGAVFETHFDPMEADRGRGAISSISSFVNTTLPEVDLPQMMREQVNKFALGGTAVETYGKATVAIQHNRNLSVLEVFITIDD